MACFDSGQMAVSGTTPVAVFTVDTPGIKNVVLMGSSSSGSIFVGSNPALTSANSMILPNGLPFTLPAIAQKGTTLYACGNGVGAAGTVYWIVGA